MTVAMNEPISPIATTSLYVASTIHRRTTMRATLTASALNTAYSASPADFDRLRAASAAKASPAMIPIDPPNAGEIAPCPPASQAETRKPSRKPPVPPLRQNVARFQKQN